MIERVARLADLASQMPQGSAPDAADVRRARRLKSKLEDVGLLDILHPDLDALLVEWIAREFAAVRTDAKKRAVKRAG